MNIFSEIFPWNIREKGLAESLLRKPSYYSLKKDFKREPTGELDNKGKPIYQINPNKSEYWLQKYVVGRNENTWLKTYFMQEKA